jgi:hypothetical protein
MCQQVQGSCLPPRPKAGRAACWPVVLRPAGQLYHHHVGSYECYWIVGDLQSVHVYPLGAFFCTITHPARRAAMGMSCHCTGGPSWRGNLAAVVDVLHVVRAAPAVVFRQFGQHR